ncbi:TlpA family protein disulfide reductase [Mucilaginibacter terrenus]|uniref:TlpA family protein disulfide reductase n=1 Tax=Mucilaginibacter terrenus TaxID=2482727 RepID=A0A3E2NRF0_9SPHI|nr:TlpA disulfide reductase family protein [Mucilaginibacter terrenus]RFZ83460.1 TlpA family protein disulfide reductase [Mucilaginibacter terrenus]
MRLLLLTTILCLHLPVAWAQQNGTVTNNKELVSLKGTDAFTTIENHTTDTLRLTEAIYYYLPVSEKSVEAVIAPGKSATFRTQMNYPDFIQFSSLPFRVFNAPGKTVKCTVESTSSLKLSFTGNLQQENDYYQAYFNVAKSNQTYYAAGARLNNFNRFPAIADSINQINLNFLNGYGFPLSPAFKKYEYWRLMYNNAFLKHHVLFDKAFKTGHEIKIDTGYYHFDPEMPLVNEDIPISSEYLWYAVFRMRHLALAKSKADSLLSTNMLAAAQEVYGTSKTGDVVKMRLLYDAYARSKHSYDKLLNRVTFSDLSNKRILDSVSNARFSLPMVGRVAPGFKLVNINGDTVSLSEFKGHLVMINFWAGWCAPCIKEFPAENKLSATYSASKKLVVINVCIETSAELWKSLTAKHQLAMVNLFADEKQVASLKRRYNISGLPKSVLIDADMKIISNNFKRASEVRLSDLEN